MSSVVMGQDSTPLLNEPSKCAWQQATTSDPCHGWVTSGMTSFSSLIPSVVVPLRQIVAYLVSGDLGVDVDVALLVECTGVAVGGAGGEPHDVGLAVVAGEELAAAVASGRGGGLEICDKRGEWTFVPPLQNTFVGNIGDTMKLWTNNRFQSTVHRVINTRGASRCSIPFFTNPDYDAIIEPIETCVGEDHPPVYDVLHCGESLIHTDSRIYPSAPI